MLIRKKLNQRILKRLQRVFGGAFKIGTGLRISIQK